MKKFHYCSSYDELKWYINDIRRFHQKRAKELNEIGRHNLRQWIDDFCIGDVYAWNEVETPTMGETNWSTKIVPHGHIRLYFTEDKDAVMFAMKWGI